MMYGCFWAGMYLAGLNVGFTWKEWHDSGERSQRSSHKLVAELFTWSDASVYKMEAAEAPVPDSAVLSPTREQLLESLRSQSSANTGEAPEQRLLTLHDSQTAA